MNRLLFLSDVAFMPYPTLEDKKAIIEYTVNVAKNDLVITVNNQ